MVKRLSVIVFSLLGVLGVCRADDPPVTQQITQFGGLNNQDNPVVIPSSQAQDLLNVDVTPGGRSVKKRHGYGVDDTLSIATSPVHGAYHFYDTNGNDVRLWMNDRNVASSSNSGAYSNIITTLTVNSTLQCSDTQGFAYCVDSSRDTLFRTDGSIAGTSWYPSNPAGTMVTASPSRLLVSGVSGNTNTLYFSQQGDPTNFTVGTQVSSAFTEVITSPGSHITHVTYACGHYMWFKDNSFGYVTGDDQFSANVIVVSNNTGTYDNTSVFSNGMLYFRGTDNHIFEYDCNVPTRITREITPLVYATNKRKSNSWTQTTQSDFNNGFFGNTNSTGSPGDVVLTTTTNQSSFTDSTNANFNAGSSTTTFVSTNTLFSASIPNNGFQGCPGAGGLGFLTPGWSQGSFSNPASCSNVDSHDTDGWSYSTGNCANTLYDATVYTSTGGIYSQTTGITPIQNIWTQRSINTSGLNGNPMKVSFKTECASGAGMINTNTFISNSNTLTWWDEYKITTGTYTLIDDIHNGADGSPGTFLSRTFDTGISSPSWVASTVSYSGDGTFLWQTQVSTDTGGVWDSLVTWSTGTPPVSASKRFIRYQVTLTTTTTETKQHQITFVNLMSFLSTGTFYTAVNNAPAITSWDAFLSNNILNGGGTLTYYVRAGTNTYAVTSTTPTWVAQTNGSVPTASTGTYMQARVDFYAPTSTQTPVLNDTTFNWFEGQAADKAYATYYDFNIWWAVSYAAAGTTNNRILKWDLINKLWTVYDIASNGFLVQNNKLYIGSPLVGQTYIYASQEDDNGSNINAYWQSKDFSNNGASANDSPFNEKDYRSISVFEAAQTTGTINVTYSVNRNAGTLYTFNLNDPNSNGVVWKNYLLPIGTRGNTLNLKFGNNSIYPFEVFGSQFSYVPKPWRVYP